MRSNSQFERPAAQEAGPRIRLFLPAAVAAIAVVWAFGLAGDLWVDEIWTVTFASSLRNPIEILTASSFDNNHPLVTFAAWLLGPRRAEFTYRLFPYMAGLATVVLMACLGRRYGERVSRLSIVLGGGCFFLFCYSVEARGYASAAAASLLCFLSLDRYLEDGSRGRLLLYWLSVPFGLLSHASFIYAFAGVLCWSALVVSRRGLPLAPELRRVHGIPVLLFLPWIGWILTRANGGGPIYGIGRTLLDVAVFATGVPDTFPANIMAALLLVTAVAVEWRRMARERNPDHLFFAVTIVAAPLVATLAATVTGNRPFYARYYLVAVPPALVLVARAIDHGAARFPRTGRWGVVALLALFLLGNGVLYFRFLEGRRGNYRDAVRFAGGRTEGTVMTLGGKSDFPVRMILDYYYPDGYVAGKKLVFVPDVLNATTPPEWIVAEYPLHVKDDIGGGTSPPLPEFVLSRGVAYRVEAAYPSGGPSGDSWNLYRRRDSRDRPPGRPVVK